MITKWWKQAVKALFAMGGGNYGFNLAVKNVSNSTFYISSGSSLNMGNLGSSLQTTATSAGISVGSGDTAATDEDYNLASTITSGLSGTITNTHGMDSDKPYVTYNVVLSNSTAADIVVKEIGAKINIPCQSSAGATGSSSNKVCLIDRTVLSTPVTVPAGGNAAILYTLKTSYSF